MILHIARREWLEQTRQPAMLGVVAATFALLAALVVFALAMLEHAAHNPLVGDEAARWLPAVGVDPAGFIEAMTGAVVGIANWLLFTQFLGISAVMAGHAVLHDRQTHALPFLLLAPVRRIELLAGKVLGAIGPSLLLYLGISGAACAFAGSLSVTAPYASRLPPSPAWAVSFLLGGPLWALFVGTVCATVSSLARDVRTAQQVVWFVVLFASFGCGFLLAVLLSEGVAVQLGVAALGGVCAALALWTGSRVIRREP